MCPNQIMYRNKNTYQKVNLIKNLNLMIHSSLNPLEILILNINKINPSQLFINKCNLILEIILSILIVKQIIINLKYLLLLIQNINHFI